MVGIAVKKNERTKIKVNKTSVNKVRTFLATD